MQIKILIKTPKGQAQKAEKKLRLFLLKNKKPDSVYTNDLDNEICWVVSGNTRQITKLTRSVTQYHVMMNMALNNKMIRGLIRKKVGQKGADELYEMLINQTHVEVIKANDEEELSKNKNSVFYKMKNLFNSKNNSN